jgi:hypothetical protein
MILMSEKIDQLFAALKKAKREFQSFDLNGFNPHFKSRYAELVDIKKATDPALDNHGLVLTQLPINDGGSVGTFTMLVHVDSGQYIGSSAALPLSRSDAQQGSAAITYSRRAGRVALFDLVAETDTDGNDVSEPEPKKPAKQRAATSAARPPKADIPTREPGDEPAEKGDTNKTTTAGAGLLSAEEFAVCRNRVMVMGRRLFADKVIEGNPNRVLRDFVLKVTGATAPESINRAEWDSFFSTYEKMDSTKLGEAIRGGENQ